MTQKMKETGVQYSVQTQEQQKQFSITWHKASAPIRQG